MSGEISYKTHILVAVRSNGAMSVIADWPHVPKQTEVQQEIDAARNGFVTFVLCTPTSYCRRTAMEAVPEALKLGIGFRQLAPRASSGSTTHRRIAPSAR